MLRRHTLCLIKHYAMKMYLGVEVKCHGFLTSALDGSKWSASHSRHIKSMGKSPW